VVSKIADGQRAECLEHPGQHCCLLDSLRLEALVSWFNEWVGFAQSCRGVVALMAAAHTNPDSALYASCAAIHSASARLLRRAQSEGTARADMNGDDPFALMAALGWAVDQPSIAPRAEYLSRIIASAILINRPSGTLGITLSKSRQ
jgi:hypothetical protein